MFLLVAHHGASTRQRVGRIVVRKTTIAFPHYVRPMDINRLSTPQKLSAGAILVVIIAAFLPWVSVFGIGVIGVKGDGVISLILGVAGAAVLGITSGLFGEARGAGRKSDITLVVLASLVALLGLFTMNGLAAIGLYLTLFGGIAWVVGAVWQLMSGTESEAVETEQAPTVD